VAEKLEGSDLSSCLLDSFTKLWICRTRKPWSILYLGCKKRTKSIVHIDCGSSSLEDTKCLNDRRGHAVLRLVDFEVLQRTLCLCSPVSIRSDLHFSKGITLCSRALAVGLTQGGCAGHGAGLIREFREGLGFGNGGSGSWSIYRSGGRGKRI
jgi:hypothetical protein